MVEAMPNYCRNELEIVALDKKGEEELEKLMKMVRARGTVFSFDKVIPYPKEYKVLDKISSCNLKKKRKLRKKYAGLLRELKRNGFDINEDGFSQGGYDWCCKFWGTKWDACDAEIVEQDSQHCFYVFDTAWEPPIPVVVELSRKFPSLWFQLRYFEKGTEYCGIMNIRAGIIEEQAELSYYGIYGG